MYRVVDGRVDLLDASGVPIVPALATGIRRQHLRRLPESPTSNLLGKLQNKSAKHVGMTIDRFTEALSWDDLCKLSKRLRLSLLRLSELRMSRGQESEDATIRQRLQAQPIASPTRSPTRTRAEQARLAVVERFRRVKDARGLARVMVPQLDGLPQAPGREGRFLAPPPGYAPQHAYRPCSDHATDPHTLTPRYNRNWRMYQHDPKQALTDLADAA